MYPLSKIVLWLLARIRSLCEIWSLRWVSPFSKKRSQRRFLFFFQTCRWSDGASGYRRQPSPKWHPPSARCRGLTNMSISWSWWFGWIVLPQLPFASSHWHSAGYRGALSGPGSLSWRFPCLCRFIGAEGYVGSRLWTPSRKPPWLPWRVISWPELRRRTWKIHHLRWENTLFRRFAWQYPTYQPGRPATEHQFSPHRCGFWWTDSAPACAAYRLARLLGIPGPFIA